MLWAGDSRAYVFEPAGARQLTTDDLRDPGDAMANLRQDSVVSNAMSADTDFHVNYRRVELRAPFLVACATDGCFGYMRTPMHFEHLVLSRMQDARNTTSWSTSMQAEIAKVTGDDAAMSMIGVGASMKEFRALFAPRLAELEEQFIGPLDNLTDAVAAAERELQELRQRQLAATAAIWSRYKADYERYLHAEPTDGDDDNDGDAFGGAAEAGIDADTDTEAGNDNSNDHSDADTAEATDEKPSQETT